MTDGVSSKWDVDVPFDPAPPRRMRSKSPTRGARYMRTYRQRQRKQKACLSVEVHSDQFVVALINSGWLTPAQTRDRRNLETAASDIIAEWQRRWRG